MSKHTPGPWRQYDTIRYVMGENGQHVASVSSGYRHTGGFELGQNEALANARLIAAAPDMLEALKKSMASYDDIFAHCLSNGVLNAWGQRMDCTSLNDAADAIRHAIAKAEASL